MKKLLNKKGFTLMEMLIVIAIIVILVAISIPAFSGSLDKAKIATDSANLRSARAAVAMKLAEGETPATIEGMIYNIKTGTLDAKGTTVGNDHYGSCSKHTSAHIVVGTTGDCAWSAGGDCANP